MLAVRMQTEVESEASQTTTMKPNKSSLSSTSTGVTPTTMDIDALVNVCHNILVADISDVARLPVTERLELATRRRQDQLDRLADYERKFPIQTAERRPPSSGVDVRHDRASGVSDDRRGGSKSDRAQRRRRKRPDSVRFAGSVTLMDAVGRKDVEEVRLLLLSSQCDVNSCNVNGITALHQACIDGNLDLVKMLVAQPNADVNVLDADQWTPLHTAALGGRSDIATALTERGADVLALNADGYMPYDLCEEETTLDVIESAMAKRGVTQEMINDVRFGPEKAMLHDLQRLSRDQVDLNFQGQSGETPLHVAAANGFVEVAEYLMSRLVPIDPVDKDSWQPIHCAAQWRQVSMLETLVRHGADLDATTDDNKTPIDLCSDETIRHWLLELKTFQEARKKSLAMSSTAADAANAMLSNGPADLVSPTSIARSSRIDGSHTQLYSSNMSLADKSAMSSNIRRFTTGHDKESSEKNKKDVREEADLWTSLQSLVEIDNENDANSFPDVILSPPDQFRTKAYSSSTPKTSEDQSITESTLLLQSMSNALRSSALPDDQRTERMIKTDIDSLQKQGQDVSKAADAGIFVQVNDTANWEFKPKNTSDSNDQQVPIEVQVTNHHHQQQQQRQSEEKQAGKSKSEKRKTASGKKSKSESKNDKSSSSKKTDGDGKKSLSLSISAPVSQSESPAVGEKKTVDDGMHRPASAGVLGEPKRAGTTSAEMKKRRSEKRLQTMAVEAERPGGENGTVATRADTKQFSDDAKTTFQHYSTTKDEQIHRNIVKDKDSRCVIV